MSLTKYRSAAGLLAWAPDDRWRAAAGRFGPGDPSEIWLLSPETGERRRLTVANDVQIGDVGLSFSPDGRFLALLRYATRSVGDVYLLPLDAGYTARGPLIRLTHEKLALGGLCWISPGNRIVYSSGGALGYRTLRMLAIDPAHPERRVEPVPFPAGEHASMLASARNRLVYAREQRDMNIRTILFNSRRSGSSDLYVLDAATRSVQRLTDDPSDEYEPRWSRDGNWIYFVSTRSERPEVWIPSGGGPAVPVTRQGGAAAFESADGRWLYLCEGHGTPDVDRRVPVDGGEETKVLDGLSYSFNFAVTDKGIYLLALRGTRRAASIELFDLATRKTTLLYTLDRPFWFGFALAPDERSILFSRIDSHGSDLILVENLR